MDGLLSEGSDVVDQRLEQVEHVQVQLVRILLVARCHKESVPDAFESFDVIRDAAQRFI